MSVNKSMAWMSFGCLFAGSSLVADWFKQDILKVMLVAIAVGCVLVSFYFLAHKQPKAKPEEPKVDA